MSFNSLKVTRKELINLLRNRHVPIEKGLSKNQLREKLEYFDEDDLFKLAKLRKVNSKGDETLNDLLEKLIFDMKYKRSQKQLLDTYPNKIEKLRSEHMKWDRRKYLKSEQGKITNALELLRQKKLVKRSPGS